MGCALFTDHRLVHKIGGIAEHIRPPSSFTQMAHYATLVRPTVLCYWGKPELLFPGNAIARSSRHAQMQMLEQDPYWIFSVFVLTSVASYIIGVIAHEFGHAGVGWLVGMPPRLIRIGEGPPLLRFRLGSALFDMRRWPI